jgi:2-polyprenyl-6-methoxyphenol hydroxylase-like FAD-dependent oxidoreductase
MAKVERVLIVGGGLAGLALTIALHQRGLSAAVVERASDWTAPGAGLYLVGNATRALRALGIADEAARKGCLIRTQTLFNHRGTCLAEIDAEAFWGGCGPCLGLARGDLRNLLAQRAAGSHIRLGVTVQSLRQHHDGVEVQLSDGSRETYDLVVGADGIRSSIRQLEFGDSSPKFLGQVGWRFIVHRPPGLDGWKVFLGPRSAFLMLPISHDRAYCYADKSNAQPLQDPTLGSIERLREEFADFASPVREVLARFQSSEPIHFSPIEAAAQTGPSRADRRRGPCDVTQHGMWRCDGIRGRARPGGDRFPGGRSLRSRPRTHPPSIGAHRVGPQPNGPARPHEESATCRARHLLALVRRSALPGQLSTTAGTMMTPEENGVRVR